MSGRLGLRKKERKEGKTGENHDTPIVLGSHIVGSPKPEGLLLERIQPSPELTWEDVQESINSMATTWVDSLVGEQLDIAPK